MTDNQNVNHFHQILGEQLTREREGLTDWLLSDDCDVEAIRRGKRKACRELADAIEHLRDVQRKQELSARMVGLAARHLEDADPRFLGDVDAAVLATIRSA